MDKLTPKERKFLINISCDEIKASYNLMEKKIDIKTQKVLRKWVDLHREKLKSLGYEKIPKRIKIGE